jgi:hypothetical protein
MTTQFDWVDIVKYLAVYIETELGGKVAFSNNAMFDDESITLKWQKYDVLSNKLLEFSHKILFNELDTIRNPTVLAKAIVEKYRETMRVKELPSSLLEKQKSFDENKEVEHWMFVAELIELLKHLKPDDWLTPNEVYNLAVGRGEDSTIATIDFAFNRIEFFNGQEDVGPWVMDKITPIDTNLPQPPPQQSDEPIVWDLVIQDMRERDKSGVQKYHTHLQPFNGRDALIDAYQEALDLVVYLRQLIYEKEKSNG